MLSLFSSGCAKFVTSEQSRRLEVNFSLKGQVDQSGAYYLIFNTGSDPVHLPLINAYINAPDWLESYNYDVAKEYIDFWDSYLVLRDSFYRFYAGPFSASGEAAKYALDGWDSSQPNKFIYQLDLTLPQVIEGQRVYFQIITVRPDRSLADSLNADYSINITAGMTVSFRDADGDVSGEGSQDSWDILDGTLRVL